MSTWGVQGDNNVYSIMTVPLIAVSASLAVYAPKWWQKSLAWGIVLLQAHQIMLLESRGCMLGCVAMVGVFLWFVPKTALKASHIGMAGLIIALLAGPPVVEEFMSSFAG